MLLTLACTTPPATDLRYLLHDSPLRLHELALSFGQAHVFHPEMEVECNTAARLLAVSAR